jgi:hypothetical protein
MLPVDGDPSRVIRDQRLAGLPRWRGAIEEIGDAPSTYGIGIAMRVISPVALLVGRAVRVLTPQATLRERPTFGEFVQALEPYGQAPRALPDGRRRGLITRSELDLLKRLSRQRALVAHQEDYAPATVEDLGRLGATPVIDLLVLIEQILRLPLIVELIAAEEGASG